MFARTINRAARIDVHVNNAGVQTWKRLLDVEEAEWDFVIETNLKGCFLCTQAAARQMKDHGRGSIVNIGSGCNKVAFPGSSPTPRARAASRCSRRSRPWSSGRTASA